MYYRAVEQNGEMAWGQPEYAIPFIEEDKASYMRHRSYYSRGRVFRETDLTRRLGSLVLTVSIETNRYVKHDARTGALLYDRTHKSRVVRCASVCTENRTKVIRTSISCFQDVADLANYFGDRLPQEFFDRYKNILIKEGE